MPFPGDGDDEAEASLLVSLLCVVAILYTFVAFHRLVSKTFVPALYVLQGRLRVGDDVAGATLMAAGGCAPGLFANVVATLLLKSSVGVGTVVGSLVRPRERWWSVCTVGRSPGAHLRSLRLA